MMKNKFISRPNEKALEKLLDTLKSIPTCFYETSKKDIWDCLYDTKHDMGSEKVTLHWENSKITLDALQVRCLSEERDCRYRQPDSTIKQIAKLIAKKGEPIGITYLCSHYIEERKLPYDETVVDKIPFETTLDIKIKGSFPFEMIKSDILSELRNLANKEEVPHEEASIQELALAINKKYSIPSTKNNQEY